MTPKQFAPLATLLLAALFVAGCGGGGGGQPTVTQTIHDELQAELDAAIATLETERAAKTAADEARAVAVTARMAADEARVAAETERDTAKAAQLAAEAARMEAEAAQAEAEADEAEAVAAQLAAEAQLATALDDKAAVEADRDEKRNEATAAAIELIEVKAARDAALDLVTRLTGELEDANSEVTRLTGVIGDETDSADAAATASLHAQLNAAKAEVASLTARVGSETDASSLTGMLEAAKADVTRLTGELQTANAEVTRLEGVIGDATQPPSLTGRLATAQAQVTTLQGQLRVSEAEVASLRRQLADARDERDEAEDRAEDAEDRAQQAVQQGGTLEANQRAENLLDTFPDTIAVPTGDSPVEMEVPSKDTLTFKQEGRTVRTLSASGLLGARLTRTRGGTDTTVVYTDRELRRTLLDHYANGRDGDTPRFNVAGITSVTVGDVDTGTNLLNHDFVTITHGLRTSLHPTDETANGVIVTADGSPTERELRSTKPSFGGSVHGVLGDFQCAGPDCMITVTNRYNNDAPAAAPVINENQLDSVTITTNTGTALHFRPRRADGFVYLCEDMAQCTAGDDGQYMTFGWWRHDPASVNGTYRFGVFSDVMGTGGARIDGVAEVVMGTAEYDGTAVGMYVDQDAIAKRQGEFTAVVRLTADFGSDTLSGEIDNFNTTPTGGSAAPATAGSWVVILADDGNATIRRRGSISMGNWGHEFVPNHGNLPAATQPLSVTGTFDTRIENLLRIIGAFGAER